MTEPQQKWTALTSFSNAIAAVAACITVLILIKTWKEQIYVNRPYFRVIECTIKPIEDDNKIDLCMYVENVGRRQAVNAEGTLYLLEKDSGEGLKKCSITTANEIPPNTPYEFETKITMIKQNLKEVYLIFDLQYEDYQLKKKQHQMYYWKWIWDDGNDETNMNLNKLKIKDASIEERKELIKAYGEEIKRSLGKN